MKAKIVGMFVLIILDIGFIVNFNKYSVSNKLVCIIFFVATILLSFTMIMGKNKSIRQTIREKKANEAAIQSLRAGNIPRLDTSSLILKEGEFSSFECDTYTSTVKNKLVGSTGSGGGVSVKVVKGLYLRSGTFGSRRIYKDVVEKYHGKFIVTNKRLVFLNSDKGFEIPYPKLTSVYSSGDTLNIQSQNKSFGVYLSSPEIIEELIKAIART
ncbi:hypothetical protein [Lacrimispora sp.]|uniref:hypothetical protein n=1 Tax=Lacrimispora sp. TaxID=2719234 RepID=UPI0028A6353E|nr:hypothetical protein [Lacrimispora sp.]